MIAILGAGISGLSLAYYLQKEGKRVVLLEKESTAGGKIKSVSEKGLMMELGPNTVLLNNNIIIDLLKETGLHDELIFADSDNISKRYILFNGKPEPIPTGVISALRSPLLSWKSIKKVFAEIKLKKEDRKRESLANLIKRHFGGEAYENFLVPMLTGIYAGDPEKMDADFVLPFLKNAEKEHGSILKAMIFGKKKTEKGKFPKSKVFTFRNGLQELPRALAEKLGSNLKLEAEVSSIEKTKNSFKIEYIQGGTTEVLEVDEIISTIPGPLLTKIKSNFLTGIFPAFKDIVYVPIAVLHMAYPKNSLGFGKKAFGLLSRPSENAPFLGVLFNSRFFPHTATEDVEMLTIICGGGFNPQIFDKSDEDLIEMVGTSLSHILEINQKPTYKRIHRWKNAIPQYYLGHGEILDSISEFEYKNPGFYFAGNYLNGISVSDCVKNSKILCEKLSS